MIVSSGSALRAFPWAAGYGATKAAQRGFAEALRHELRGSGVSVTTVYPGEIASDLHAHEKATMPAWYHGGGRGGASAEAELAAAASRSRGRCGCALAASTRGRARSGGCGTAPRCVRAASRAVGERHRAAPRGAAAVVSPALAARSAHGGARPPGAPSHSPYPAS